MNQPNYTCRRCGAYSRDHGRGVEPVLVMTQNPAAWHERFSEFHRAGIPYWVLGDVVALADLFKRGSHYAEADGAGLVLLDQESLEHVAGWAWCWEYFAWTAWTYVGIVLEPPTGVLQTIEQQLPPKSLAFIQALRPGAFEVYRRYEPLDIVEWTMTLDDRLGQLYGNHEEGQHDVNRWRAAFSPLEDILRGPSETA